jgi:hypothetical protein
VVTCGATLGYFPLMEWLNLREGAGVGCRDHYEKVFGRAQGILAPRMTVLNRATTKT